ncbi:hypothetical protein [Streptomyces sp. NPDC090036]|uniref:hypothetical protein n=1 Tax=Streptomyces sp. NPDC090036 TaxID=3365926 RepID=UPI003815581A
MADPQSNAVAPARPANPIPADAPSAGVIHFRHRHTDRFTVVGNHLAQHPHLSAVAIGLAVYIQSVPDGVSITAKALTLRFREGEITIRRALNELEEAGYLERRRIPLGGGRFATRTLAYDKPGCAAVPSATPGPQQPAAPQAQPEPEPVPPTATGPAADLLARLRTVDARLILSVRDVQRLTPAVEEWLARHATPEQITRTLTANLPPAPVPIHHPPRFLEHRLTTLLPPPLPVSAPEPHRPRPAPLITCDECERAFRSHVPDALCADCGPRADPSVA